ncbi:MAG: hypothetical protein ACKPGH_17600, partial [Dolichospermum sp.]
VFIQVVIFNILIVHPKAQALITDELGYPYSLINFLILLLCALGFKFKNQPRLVPITTYFESNIL